MPPNADRRVEPAVRGPARTRLTEVGLYAFAALVPVSIALAQASMALVALGWLAGIVRARRLGLVRDPLVWPLLAFVAVKLLAASLGETPRASFLAARGDWTILFVLLLNQAIDTPSLAGRLLVVFAGASAVAGFYGLAQFFLGVDYVRDRALEPFGRGYVATGFFGHHLTYGGVLLLGFLAAFTRTLVGTARERRLAMPAAFGTGAGLVASVARTAWMGSLAGLFALVVLTGRRALVRLAIAGALVALVLALRPEVRERAASAFDVHDDPRWPLWVTASHMVADRPLLGAGPGSFQRLFPSYRVPGAYKNTGHPHNDILNQLVQVGFVGTAAWLAIWIRLLWILVAAWRAREARDDARAAILAASLCGVVGFLAGGLGQCFFTDEEVVMGVWLLAALGLAAARPRSSAAAHARTPSIPGRALA